MLLYHGSQTKSDVLKRHQADAPDVDVPEGELQNAIYATPDYGFAVACASRPEGMTKIDGENKTIEFEHPELFDPEQDIYVYAINTDSLPEGCLMQIDDHQHTIDLDELKPDIIEHKKAREVMKYYKLVNWKPKEIDDENKEIYMKVR